MEEGKGREEDRQPLPLELQEQRRGATGYGATGAATGPPRVQRKDLKFLDPDGQEPPPTRKPIPLYGGRSGALYLVEWEEQERVYKEPADPEDLMREIDLLMAVGEHPNVIRCEAVVYQEEAQQGYLMPRLDGTLLAFVRNAPGRLETTSLLRLLAQIARALDHIHNRRESVAHRDLHFGNVLYEDTSEHPDEPRLVLADLIAAS
jgi:serine/threonine protein kinase